MKKVHVPTQVLEALHQTAARMGGLELDQLIPAVIWAFSQQDPAVKNTLVRDGWFRGFEEEHPKAKQSLFRRVYELAKNLYAAIRQSIA